MSHESAKTPAELRFDNEQLRKALHRSTATLRDQFAVAAMLGLLSNPEYSISREDAAKHGSGDAVTAYYAYSQADAMLEAREAK